MMATLTQSPVTMEMHVNGSHASSPREYRPMVKDEPKAVVSTEVLDVNQLGFQVMETCTYTPKYIGSSDQEALGCECAEDWGTA